MSSSSNFWLCLSLLTPSCHDPCKVSCLSHLVCLAQQGPACRTLLQLESQALVRLPVQVLLALFLLDDFTGFQITNLLSPTALYSRGALFSQSCLCLWPASQTSFSRTTSS